MRELSSDALAQAYERTTYWVAAKPQPIGLRVGGRPRTLHHVLAQQGALCWAFVTAWNPRSARTPAWRNARYQRELKAWLKRRGLRWIAALGEGDDADWTPEPSFFVPGMSAREALRCARRFRQNAVVIGGLWGRAELIWCRPTDCTNQQPSVTR
jgi:hypothetical protein